MAEDTRTHWLVVDESVGNSPGSVKNTEGEARSHADMLVRMLGSRSASVYKLVATYRAEPVVVVVDADPNTDGRGVG